MSRAGRHSRGGGRRRRGAVNRRTPPEPAAAGRARCGRAPGTKASRSPCWRDLLSRRRDRRGAGRAADRIAGGARDRRDRRDRGGGAGAAASGPTTTWPEGTGAGPREPRRAADGEVTHRRAQAGGRSARLESSAPRRPEARPADGGDQRWPGRRGELPHLFDLRPGRAIKVRGRLGARVSARRRGQRLGASVGWRWRVLLRLGGGASPAPRGPGRAGDARRRWREPALGGTPAVPR